MDIYWKWNHYCAMKHKDNILDMILTLLILVNERMCEIFCDILKLHFTFASKQVFKALLKMDFTNHSDRHYVVEWRELLNYRCLSVCINNNIHIYIEREIQVYSWTMIYIEIQWFLMIKLACFHIFLTNMWEKYIVVKNQVIHSSWFKDHSFLCGQPVRYGITW